MMSICFERTGEQRKALVVAIGEITGIKPKYMGAPGFAYSIGGYTITKDGTLECDELEDTSALLTALAERGFVPEGETATDVAEPTETGDIFSIELPSDRMHDAQRERLNRLVSSKATLIRAALSDNLAHGTRGLPIDYMDDKVCFPWFKAGMDAGAVDAWSRFVCALRDTAIKQKRVVMSNKPYDGSEKYAMRCFLLKLGFIGEEYKSARKILLANLSGNGSHKNPKEDTLAPASEEQDAEYELAEALADAELIHSVTVEYQGGKPARVDTVVISTQHTPEISHTEIEEAVIQHVASVVLPLKLVDRDTRYLINPTGRFVTGGPRGDTGLTGRKIIVDTYGGFARHGGGAFSGKDPTKVDRSAAYAARHVAKNLVAAGIAKRLEVQIAYAIGVAQPVSIAVDTFGTGKLPDAAILDLIARHFDLRPAAIIERLGLRRPIYAQTAAYGHFGRNDLDLPWERLDVSERLKMEAGL